MDPSFKTILDLKFNGVLIGSPEMLPPYNNGYSSEIYCGSQSVTYIYIWELYVIGCKMLLNTCQNVIMYQLNIL